MNDKYLIKTFSLNRFIPNLIQIYPVYPDYSNTLSPINEEENISTANELLASTCRSIYHSSESNPIAEAVIRATETTNTLSSISN